MAVHACNNVKNITKRLGEGNVGAHAGTHAHTQTHTYIYIFKPTGQNKGNTRTWTNATLATISNKNTGTQKPLQAVNCIQTGPGLGNTSRVT